MREHAKPNELKILIALFTVFSKEAYTDKNHCCPVNFFGIDGKLS